MQFLPRDGRREGLKAEPVRDWPSEDDAASDWLPGRKALEESRERKDGGGVAPMICSALIGGE